MTDVLSSGGADSAAWARIAELGSTLEKTVIEASFRLIEPLHQPQGAAVNAVLEEERAYGPHARHRVDIYRSQDASGPLKPILLFVHGGGYASGDKRMGAFFANLGHWAAASGLIGAAMNYRLAPDYTWPSAQEDIKEALGWLRAHARELGADPDRIFLMGHSAGAGHCANYAANRQFHAAPGGGVAGIILISGVYDLVLAGEFGRSSRSLYYGTEADGEAERSCLDGLAAFAAPIATMVAELDPPELHAQAKSLIDALYEANGTLPAFTRLARHNHYTEILSTGLPMAAQMHHALLDFISLDCAAGAQFARPKP